MMRTSAVRYCGGLLFLTYALPFNYLVVSCGGLVSDLDASDDAGHDASEASSDSMNDVGDASTSCTASNTGALNLCASSATCYPPKGTPTCNAQLLPCGVDFLYYCSPTGGNKLCAAPSPPNCCVALATVTPGACGTISAPNGMSATCGDQCDIDGGHQLCTTDSQCEAGVGGVCVPKHIDGFESLDGALVGVCE